MMQYVIKGEEYASLMAWPEHEEETLQLLGVYKSSCQGRSLYHTWRKGDA